jgi:hypothetical protein
MPQNTTHVVCNSHEPASPPTVSISALIARGGTKALQQILEKLGRGHAHKHGYAWNYAGAAVRREGKVYFIDYDGQTRYLGTFRDAVEHLSQYAVTGTPNASMRRAR